MVATFELQGRRDSPVRVIRLESAHDLSGLPESLGVQDPMPTVVVVGGAGGLDAESQKRLEPFFAEGLAAAIEEVGGAVVDGGTDAGVMRLAGGARARIEGTFPLVGVAAAGTVKLPGASGAPAIAAAPEPNHSHLVLVPGDRFGEESPWIADVASEISDGRPSVTLLAGGGAVTWEDVENSVAVGRPVIVLQGSGGTADALAEGLARPQRGGRAGRLAATGRFRVVSIADGPSALRQAIEGALLEPDGMFPAERRAEETAADAEALLRETIAELPLPEPKKRFLDGRWLEQIQWMERKAAKCQRDYYRSRRIIIVGSALVPVLATSSLLSEGGDDVMLYVRVAATVVSLLVAIAAAWEEFFRNGERWRHYRHTIEQLRSEGWLFFERSGPYAEYPSHARAHAAFVLRVEQILSRDVRLFVSQVATEKKDEPSPAAAQAQVRKAATTREEAP